MPDIDSDTADDLVLKAFENIRTGVEGGRIPLSSESALRFLFAWELGRLLEYSPSYRFDIEWNAYAGLDSEDTFLDLLIFTDPHFKVAIEFKLPKSSGTSKTGQTQIRAKIIRDISRLSYLVQRGINSVKLGYFICATNEGPYLSEGRKTENPQYKTYHGHIYQAGATIPPGTRPNGIERELHLPKHEVRFEWEGMEDKGRTTARFVPKGRFAWLKPIKIWA